MKMIVQCDEDIALIQGKFVLQINSDKPSVKLKDLSWSFAKEKRLYIVSGLGLIDLYGNRKDFETFEKFKNYFNNYLFDHMIAEGKTDGGRFHRLLTSSELEYLFQRIKEENY